MARYSRSSALFQIFDTGPRHAYSQETYCTTQNSINPNLCEQAESYKEASKLGLGLLIDWFIPKQVQM